MAKKRAAPRVFSRDRQDAWLLRHIATASEFEKRVALWAGVSPSPSIEDVERDILAAWSPAGQQYLHDLVEQAKKDPGPDGLGRAIRSARRVWREVTADPPVNKGGRRPTWEGRQHQVWLLFHAALGKARLDGRKVSKAEMVREFASRSAAGKGYWHNNYSVIGHAGTRRLPADAVTLTSAAQLEKVLKSVERATPKQQRNKMLQRYLPEVAHLLMP